MELADYDFEILHRPGTSSGDVDMLSRMLLIGDQFNGPIIRALTGQEVYGDAERVRTTAKASAKLGDTTHGSREAATQ
jgi:hypothetical protein